MPGQIGAFHRVLNNEELWLIHLGRLVVHVLSPGGVHTASRLGANLAAGERPALSVPLGHWQAAEIPKGVPFALGANVCAPGFTWDEFELADRADLVRQFPNHRNLIERLTPIDTRPKWEVYERER